MRINAKRTVLVGLGFFTICVFWQLYNSIIPLILKQTFDLNEGLAGVIMGADNMLAVFMLPIFGMLSDKTKTRMGKRMPYIVLGTALSVISMILLVIFNTETTLIPFIIVLGILLIAMSTYRSPTVALMPDVTPKPLLSKGNAIINLMGTFGGIFALIYIALLSPKEDGSYMPLFLAVAVTMVIGIAIMMLWVKENDFRKEKEAISPTQEDEESEYQKLSKAKQKSLLFMMASIFLWFFGYNAIISAYSKYAIIQWKLEGGLYAYALLVASATALLAFLPIGVIATKIGRKKTIFIGIALLATAFGGASLFMQFHPIILALFGLAGIGWAAINVNSYPMVVSLSKGSDIGKYTGYYYTASMASQIITPIVSGLLLEYVGYWTLFPYGAAFVALSALTLLYVKHGDLKPEKLKSKLEAFDLED